MPKYHVRFHGNDDNKWQIRNEVDEDSCQRGEGGPMEEYTDQVTKENTQWHTKNHKKIQSDIQIITRKSYKSPEK